MSDLSVMSLISDLNVLSVPCPGYPIRLLCPVCHGCLVCLDDHDDHDYHDVDDYVDHDVYGNHDDRLRLREHSATDMMSPQPD